MTKENLTQPVVPKDEQTDEFGLPNMKFYELKEHFGGVEPMLRAYLQRFVYREVL